MARRIYHLANAVERVFTTSMLLDKIIIATDGTNPATFKMQDANGNITPTAGYILPGAAGAISLSIGVPCTAPFSAIVTGTGSNASLVLVDIP